MINPPSQFLELLGSASLRAAALILLLLALRPWLRRAFGSPLVSLLWLAVLMRLLVPWSVESAWHPLALSSRVAAPISQASQAWKVRVSIEEGVGARTKTGAPGTTLPQPNRAATLAGMWMVGAIAALLFFSVRMWRTRGLVRRTAPVEDFRLLEIFRGIPESIRQRVELRITDEIPVAALVGIRRPQILLPRSWISALSDVELRHVLLHELGHSRRRDLLVQWLFAFAQCLHWFNPLVWLAARWARADAELACDAWVLVHAGEQERSGYGHTLLRTSQLSRHHGSIVPLAIGMAASCHTLAARVRAVGAFRPHTGWQTIAGMLIASALAGSLMTRPGVAQESPATSPVVSAPTPPAAPVSEAKPAAGEKPAAEAQPAATPNPNTASSTPSAPPAVISQIEIESKFFELSEESAKKLKLIAPDFSGLSAQNPTTVGAISTALPPGTMIVTGVMTAEQSAKLVQSLGATKGVDLVAAPRVTMKSAQRAVVEMIREFRYPTEFAADKKTGKVTPTAFETRNIGITMATEAVVGPDGYTIDLNLTPEVVELEGFVGTDGQTIPLRGGRGIGANLTLNDLAGVSMTKNGILQPLFSTRKVTTSISVFSGQTVMLGGFKRDLKGERKATLSRFLYVLISARIVDPSAPPPVASPATTLGVKPVPVTNTTDAKEQIPTALAAPAGFVRSPFAPDAGLIDVRGFAPGTKIACPYTGKTFKTP